MLGKALAEPFHRSETASGAPSEETSHGTFQSTVLGCERPEFQIFRLAIADWYLAPGCNAYSSGACTRTRGSAVLR